MADYRGTDQQGNTHYPSFDEKGQQSRIIS